MLALCSKALGEDQAAASYFERALERAPENPDLLGNCANFLIQAGRLPEAIALYQRQLQLAPDHADGWKNLGLALLNAGVPVAASAPHATRRMRAIIRAGCKGLDPGC